MENNGQRGATETRERHLIAVLRGIRGVNQLIVSEDDPERLIERACESLTATMGYHNAWIALLGGEAGRALGLVDQGAVSATAAAGFNGGFGAMRERLLRGEFPACMGRALRPGTRGSRGTRRNDCPDCPLAGDYGGRAGLTRRLEFDGVTYGILAASVPADYAETPRSRSCSTSWRATWPSACTRSPRPAGWKESRRSYRDLFEKHSAAKLIIDPDDGRIVGANAAAAKFYGWSRDELCRMKISDINTLTPAQVKTEMEKARALERTHFEFEHRRQTERPGCGGVQLESRIRRQGAALLDHSRHHGAQGGRGKLVLLGKMIDAAPAAITIHDTDGNFLFSNQQNRLLHGYDSEEEFLALNLHDLDVPESAALIEAHRIIERGEARPSRSAPRKDGTVFPLEVLAKQIEWAGRPAVLSIATDITERKRGGGEGFSRPISSFARPSSSSGLTTSSSTPAINSSASEHQLRAYNQQLADQHRVIPDGG